MFWMLEQCRVFKRVGISSPEIARFLMISDMSKQQKTMGEPLRGQLYALRAPSLPKRRLVPFG
ncbi:hypothetical protein ACIQWS_23910 [Phyllobacterium sp. NPDC097923]|jgi:hypothetical protein|uniref:hypothetical protein n=2 Tax=Phyllobacterium TaxID=28100 RepID=UPI00383B5391